MAYPFGYEPYGGRRQPTYGGGETYGPSYLPYVPIGGQALEQRQPGIVDYLSELPGLGLRAGSAVLHTALYPFSLGKQAVDWAARTGARAQGLNVPDTMTVEQMLGEAVLPEAELKGSYSKTLARRGLEFVTAVGLDPLTWAGAGVLRGAAAATPGAKTLVGALGGQLSAASRARGTAARILAEQPGIALYAKPMATALASAIERPGASRAVTSFAKALGKDPESIVRAQLLAEKGLHGAFVGSMALGGAESLSQAAQRYAAEGFTPEVAGDVLTGLLSGGMVGVSIAAGRRASRTRAEAIKAVHEMKPTDVVPVDRVPDSFQEDAEWRAHDLAELPHILKMTPERVAEFLPEHLQPYANEILEQAKGESLAMGESRSFLEKMRSELPGSGAEGITREERPGQPGSWYLVQRNKAGDIVGGAQVDGGGLTFITGGRGAGAKESVRPLYEELTKLGVERPDTAAMTPLGAMARRRGAERRLRLPREVLEGRLTPQELHAAIKKARQEMEEEGLDDLALGPMFAVDKEGKAKPYFSRLRRVVDDPKTQATQRGSDWLRFFSDPKRQVKSGELEWTGLRDYLNSRSGERVTKQEIQSYLDNNQFEVEEVTRGSQVMTKDEAREAIRAGSNVWPRIAQTGDPLTLQQLESIRVEPGAETRFVEGGRGTKFASEDLNLPGGTNYREVVITRKRKPVHEWDKVEMDEQAKAEFLAQTGELQRQLEAEMQGRLDAQRERDATGYGTPERIDAAAKAVGYYMRSQALGREIDKFRAQHRRATIERMRARGETVIDEQLNFNDWLARNGELERRGIERGPATEAFVNEEWQRGRDAENIRSNTNTTEVIGSDLYDAWRADQDKIVQQREALRKDTFTGGHFPDKDVLAHFRMKEDQGPNGERVLRVEEIQSDWAEQGRDLGFRKDGEAARLESEISALHEQRRTRPDTQADIDRLERLQNELKAARVGGLPDAPFVKKTDEWVSLAAKRILKYAADEGFDKVAWTTGDHQNARYDLSKRLSAIHYDPASKNLTVFGRDGDILTDRTVTPEELAGEIGKELSWKLLQQELVFDSATERDIHVLEGDGMQVGGEGMRAFYDEIVPQAFGKLVGKFGGKVGKTEIDLSGSSFDEIVAGTGGRQGKRDPSLTRSGRWSAWGPDEVPRDFATEAEAKNFADQTGGDYAPQLKTTFHSVDITPEMRDAISSEGFPLFAVAKKGEKASASAPEMQRLLLKLYPNGSKIRVTDSGTYEVTLPNKRQVIWRPRVDHIEIDLGAFEEAYGRPATEAEKKSGAKGVTYRLPGQAIVEIVDGANMRIPLHEHWHVLKHLGVLTDAQQKKLSEKFKNEEAEADAFADWWEKGRKEPNTIWEKVATGIQNMYQALVGAPEAVFREVAKGALSAEAAEAARVRARGAGRAKVAGAGDEAQRVVPKARRGVDLEDLAAAVEVDGKRRIYGSFGLAQRLARGYVEASGRSYLPPLSYVKVDKERSKRIADAYEAMKHDPENPEVKAAYEALTNETLEQFELMIASGLKVDFITDKDPYGGNPRRAIDDIVRNNHLWVYPTDSGFGDAQGSIADVYAKTKHPLLAPTKYQIGGRTMYVNDVFRAVHDYFGHAKEGVGFRADGEENAWRSHSAMYSPLARRAMTTETRGQNSWLNYGPYGEKNRTAKVEDTVFADQKAGLLPEWVTTEGAADVVEGMQATARGWKAVWGEAGPVGKLIKNANSEERRAAGAPPGITTMRDFEALKERLKSMAWRGAVARKWYTKSSQMILDSVAGNKADAEKIAQLVAIYSPNTDVDMNIEAAFRAWDQYKSGATEINSGRYSAMDERAQKLLFDGKDWDGRKTNNFYRNLMLRIDPTNPALKDLVTVDVHIMRAMGFQEPKKGGVAPGEAQYKWVETFFRDIAHDLGWDPHEAQAAVWTTQKYKTDVLDKLKPGETPPPITSYDFADAARDMLGHVNLEVVPHASTGMLPQLAGADYATRREYTEGLIKRVLFDAQGRDRVAQLFGIPVQGGFLSPGYYKGRGEPGFRGEVVMATEPRGQYALLRHLGLGDWTITKKNIEKGASWNEPGPYRIDRDAKTVYLMPGIKDSAYGPAVRDAIKELSGKPGEVDAFFRADKELDSGARRQMRRYAAALGYIFRQEGVGFGRTFQARKETEANAYRFNIGRKLTEVETESLMEGIARELNTVPSDPRLADVYPKTVADGVTIVNFGDMENRVVLDAARRAAANVLVDIPGTGGYAREVGELVSDNWAQHPDGEGHVREVSLGTSGSERSGVLAGIQRLRQEADAYNAEFAASRGWGQAPRGAAPAAEGPAAPRPGVAAPAEGRGPPPGSLPPKFAVAAPAGAVPEPPPLGRPMEPGEAPRVEHRVESLEGAVAEQRKLGIQTHDLVLSRGHRRTWDSLDPAIREKLKTWRDEDILDKIGRKEHLDDVEVQALDAVVRGRREAKELARIEYQGTLGTPDEAAARKKYADSLANFVTMERANVNDGTGTARALAARARIMEAGATADRQFMRQVFREMPGVSDADAAEMQQMFESGDPRLSDALRAATAGRWKQWQTLLRAFLITPSSEIANTLGNTIVQGVELADAGAAAGVDWLVSRLRGTGRERYLGEVGAELGGMLHAVPEAVNSFVKERFWDIYKRAWTGESKKIELGRRLEHQVSPFKSKIGRLFATSLDALQAGDELFQAPIAQGELTKRAYRKARQELGQGATGDALNARTLEIAADVVRNPEKHAQMLGEIKSAVDRRLFRNKPWKPVEIVRQMTDRYPWLTAVMPFVKTPANIARYAIHHSPLGMLTPEFGRALDKLVRNQGDMTQGQASDIVAQRIVGTMVFGSAIAMAKTGKITGGGPVDPDEKRALQETGWRPYSFKIEVPGGKTVYVPFSRFDPVAQMFGVAADVIELKDTRDANDVASKAIGSIAENFTNRTYLKGLIDFTEAVNDPMRFAGQYASNIASMHIPRQVARIAQAIDPVMRDVRPEGKGVGSFLDRVLNTAQSNVPWLSENLPARYGPTGEVIIRPGEGAAGAAMRAFSPIQVSVGKPERNLEGLMAKIGYVPSQPRNVMTVQGRPVPISPQLLELVHKADKAAAYELRMLVNNPLFLRLPDTVEEGGGNSKEGVMRKVYDKHRDIARRRIFQTYEFRQAAREELAKAREQQLAARMGGPA